MSLVAISGGLIVGLFVLKTSADMNQNNEIIRLAIVTSHPVQYNVPIFEILAVRSDIEICVFYSWEGPVGVKDPEFGVELIWDIPLFRGYNYQFVENVSKAPGTSHFNGLNNPGMIGAVRDWKADAVLVYGWAFKTHLATIRYFKGRIPVFFRGDSTLLTGGGYFRLLLRKIILKWVYQYVDIAFYPGQRSRDYFEKYGLTSSQLRHIPHAIDDIRFSKNSVLLEANALNERRKLGIKDDDLVLLFAGKLVPRKQPIFLLEAVMALVKLGGERIHLIFVGTGELEKKLISLSCGLSYIHFLGFRNQTEMPMIYRLGDVYVLPSIIETWGLGVNEAMACSRPVLVSDQVGCAPDLVKDNISGKVFPARSKDELIRCIQEFSHNRKLTLDQRRTSRLLIKKWSLMISAKLVGDNILAELKKSYYKIHSYSYRNVNSNDKDR